MPPCHPEASAVYCDMQHFGAADSLLVYPSITGFALQRVLIQIERNGPAPIRCLVRADAMRAALPIVQVGQWAVTLAAAGELHRVPEALYRRRVRPDSLSIKMRSGGPAQARAGTLEWGVGVFLAGLPAIPPQDAPRLLLFVADQLMNHRPRRNYHFDMAAAGREGRMQFLSEFLREVHRRSGVTAFPELVKGGDAEARLTERLARCREPEVEVLVLQAMLAELSLYRR